MVRVGEASAAVMAAASAAVEPPAISTSQWFGAAGHEGVVKKVEGGCGTPPAAAAPTRIAKGGYIINIVSTVEVRALRVKPLGKTHPRVG
jgi:hypothetical protein